MVNNDRPSREERLQLVNKAIERARQEPCPYCKDLDIGYHGWAERSQMLGMFVSEPNPMSWTEENQEEKAIKHPEYLTQHDNFKLLICTNCGFTKMFRFPPF